MNFKASLKGLLLSLVFVMSFNGVGEANEDFVFWPGAQYKSSIPTLKQVIGHENGERVTWPKDVITYFDALSEAAPTQIKVWEYARTWEGRPLIYAAISSPENIARLAEISSGMKQLADPRITSAAKATEIIANMPGVVWLSYGVHGNEISSTDAAIMTAYHLLASIGDERIESILENTVIFIDPMQNPDGRARFVHNFEIAEGLMPDAGMATAEHNEPWPGGRTNHYLFDMNRDWFVMTQPESEGRVRIIQDWYPLAFVDAHEMGSNSSYFFAPDARPFNPHLAVDQRASQSDFGKNNAKWFDEFGFNYFTKEVFDAMYPGYGASWPSYFGSVAMTYERGSARGLIATRSDGSQFNYNETVKYHFVTSLATAEVVSNKREKLLGEFYEYRKSAIEEGLQGDIRSYLIPTQMDQSTVNKMVGLLGRQGVEVNVSQDGFKACGVNYDAGSYMINLAQPSKRLVRTLMDEDVPMKQDFIDSQERLRAKNIPDQIYDVTAWSFPGMYNVKADNCNRVPSGDFEAASIKLVIEGSVKNPDASVAYLVPWGSTAAAKLLTKALRAGLVIMSTDKAFTLAGREYSAGTLILKVKDNPTNLSETLVAMASLTGAEVVGVNDSWVTSGVNFGSNNVVKMDAPKVAMAWDRPTSSSAAGNTRFVIERQFGYPVSAIRTAQLSSAELSRYQVLILPDGGNYKGVLGIGGTENIKLWVKNGGTLIAMGRAMRFVTDPDVNLMSIRRENAFKGPEVKGENSEETIVEGVLIKDERSYLTSIEPKKESPDSVAGVLINARVDQDHWLGAGVAETLNVLVRGSDIYTPQKLDKGVNVARFLSESEILDSGYIWSENRKQLAYKPFVVTEGSGRGQVIGFTQDPTVRAYLDGLNVILMNAIFRGSAHSFPVK